MVALVRSGTAFSDMVVACERQHTAPRRGTRHIGVLEHVRGAVNTWAFAIPNAKHAVEFIAARRRKTQLLCAPQSRGSQFLVHTGLEHDVL